MKYQIKRSASLSMKALLYLYAVQELFRLVLPV